MVQPVLALTLSNPPEVLAQPYDDDPMTHLEADSDVQNHRLLVPGNLVVMALDRRVRSLVRIGEVTETPYPDKPKRVCAVCNRTRVHLRKGSNDYYCYTCKADQPTRIREESVTRFRAIFDDHLQLSAVDFDTLWSEAHGNNSTTSLRKLDESKLLGVLVRAGVVPHFGFDDVLPAGSEKRRHVLGSGSREVTSRQRVDQGPWRRAVERRQQSLDPFTGHPYCRATRQGAHLIRWAGSEVQDADHGLILRVDHHALEEAGLLRFRVASEGSVTAVLHPSLRDNPEYCDLHEQLLALPAELLPPRATFERHWKEQEARLHWPAEEI